MAMISDPDQLNRNTEYAIDPTTTPPTVRLLVAGNLSSDGVPLDVLYSALKDEYRSDATLPSYTFPLDPVFDESFIWVDNWEPYDETTRKLIRNAGWVEQTALGVTKRIYSGVISTPPTGVAGTDQVYYEHVSQTPTNFARAGAVNEAVQVYGDLTNGNFDRRASDLKLFCRTAQKTYAGASIFANYSITALGPIAYRAGIEVVADAKATVAFTGIDANSDGVADVAPYSGMTLERLATSTTIAMAGGTYSFRWVFDCNAAALQRGYECAMWMLTLNADIDSGSGTRNGKTAPQFVSYLGDTLLTAQLASGEGVAFINFDVAGINSIQMRDNTGTLRSFPYTSALRLIFNEILQGDAAAKYWVFPTAGFNSAGCSPVKDADGVDMTGDVDGNATITHSYDWTANGDLNVTVVAIGASGARYVRATGAIIQSTENQVSLTPGNDPVYANPA